MREELLGSIQPVLQVLLDPGESVLAVTGAFAWMTDSISRTSGEPEAPDQQDAPGPFCVYTATGEPGAVAFASKLPGQIMGVDVRAHPGEDASGTEGYLVHRSGLMAGTQGIRVTTGFRQIYAAGDVRSGLVLWHVSGCGRAWVELPGDVVRRELTAGQSLRVDPSHIGMADASVTVQLARLHDHDVSVCAVLSGPGTVWLQSMSLGPDRPAERNSRLPAPRWTCRMPARSRRPRRDS